MKVGMFLTPFEQTLYSGISLPPHTLGVMTSYLRGKGNTVTQYDLNTDLLDCFGDGTLTKEDVKFIYDKAAVLGYLQGEENLLIERFIEKMLADKPVNSFEIAGVSIGGSFFWMALHSGLLFGKYIKKKYRIPVVIGGNNMVYLDLFKSVYTELWQAITGAFKFVIVGAGPESFHQIIQRLESNPQWTPEQLDIKGLAYMKNGEIFHNQEDISLVIKPDFRGLRLDYYMNFLKDPRQSSNPLEVERQNLDQLFRWPTSLIQFANKVYRKRDKGGFLKKLTIPYVFNYHCPYRCAFCAESDKNNQVVIGDPIQVVKDIEELLNEYDTQYVYFYNNYFNLSRKFVTAFCEEVKRRKLKFYWQDCARFDRVDLDLLQKMKESGCMTLWFGMETGGEKLMKMLNKKLNLQTIDEGLELCKKVGIWVNLEMIVGFPHENRNDFIRTVKFIKGNLDRINFFQNNRYFVVPNSTIGKFPERFKIEIVKDVITYDSLLQDNCKWFFSGENLGQKPNNFHLYCFNETGGRKYDEIVSEGHKRLMHMHQLQRKEFTEMYQILLFMDKIEKSKMAEK
jgi:radical SAM superfamily enzyme YgiQ (UPF0313 family)